MATAKVALQCGTALELARWTGLYSSAMPGLSIVTFPNLLWWQWSSMDRGHNIMWMAVVIDRHASRGGQ